MLLFSNKEIVDITSKLADRLTTSSDTRDTFISDNHWSVELLVNTWVLLYEQVDDVLAHSLHDKILKENLFDIIKEFDDFAFSIITEQPDSSGFLYRLLQMDLDQATVLQLLRYPKRLTLVSSEVLEKKANTDFVAWNNRNKMFCRKAHSRFVFSWLRSILAPLDSWIAQVYATKEYKEYFCDHIGKIIHSMNSGENIELIRTDPKSDGVTIIRSRTLVDKVFAYLQTRGTAPMALYYDIGSTVTSTVDAVAFSNVPKSYKTYRTIAPDQTFRQVHNVHVAKMAEDSLDISPWFKHVRICLHDQDVQREACRAASLSAAVATEDAEHASDSINMVLLRSVLPLTCKECEFAQYLYEGGNGKLHLNNIPLTSGSVLTPIMESLIFAAIAEMCAEMYLLFSDDDDHLEQAVVYLDDVTIDSKLHDLYREICQCCGISINATKSFGDTTKYYREACGKEYYRGVDLTSVYFPRKALTFNVSKKNSKVVRGPKTDKSLVSIVKLQHRLFRIPKDIGYKAQYYLAKWVRDIFPEMTFSSHSEMNPSDLLGYGEAIRITHPPVKQDPYWTDPKGVRYVGRKKGESPSERPKLWEMRQAPEECSREAHYAPSTRWVSVDESRAGTEFCEAMAYVEYLLDGPQYDDPLLRLLGVSTSRKQRWLPRRPVTTWKLQS